MRRLLVSCALVGFCLLTAVMSRVSSQSQKAEPAMQVQESKSPIMVSFADLKFVDLPERKGHQYALL